MDRGRRTLAGDRVAAPHAGPQASRPHGGQLTVAQLRRSLDGQALDRVEVTVKDPPDRAVGGGDPTDEAELLAGRRPGSARLSIERERPGLFESRERRFGKGGNSGTIALRCAGGDAMQDVIKLKRVLVGESGYERTPSTRPRSWANPTTRAV